MTINRMDELIRDIRGKIRENYDAFCCVSGREGIGKSTMAYHLCKMVDPNFNVEDRIVYSLKEFHKKIYETPRYGAVLIDEGMEVFYKRDWHKPERKYINRILAMARQRNLFYVFCAPRFTDLDELLRNWRIRMWVHMPDRGVGYVHFIDDDPGASDPWHLRDMTERRKKNYWSQILCPPWPEEDHTRYKKIKETYFEEVGKDNGEVTGKRETKTVEMFAKTIRAAQKLGITITKLSETSGIPESTYRSTLHRVERQIGDALLRTNGAISDDIYNL